MYRTTAIIVVLMLLVVLYIQLVGEQRRAYEDSIETFTLINNRLEENEKELSVIQKEYTQTCLYNAEVIAGIVDNDPDILNDLEGLRGLALLLEVDEIHIFDTTGRIFTGTHPQYYDYTFDSGEQMRFFKPMLEDKTLSLVQDITPNTAEGKLMQYSAVWCKNGKYIVQIGMEPVNIQKATEKNEITYVFASFNVNADVDYYDIDAASGKIIGSTVLDSIGCNVEEIGLDFDKIKNDDDGFHANINGQISFCVFQKTGDTYLGRAVTISRLYGRISSTIVMLSVCLLLLGLILALTVTEHIKKYVVEEIQDINDKLHLITDGNFDETIEVRSSIEFAELSDYLNTMLKNILDNNVKMAYVLNKTNMPIGIYEYNNSVSKVRFTEYVPQIFSMNADEMETVSSDIYRFVKLIRETKSKPVPDEPNVYMVGDKYIKLEEIINKDNVFGVVMDVTPEITKRKELETERDIDLLTGLLNRRGFDIQLDKVLADPETIDHYAVIMIDADGLKMVNDTYGHDSGDIYLKEIASVIKNFGAKENIASRMGGDEFVLFLYGYSSKEELEKTIEMLEFIRDNISVRICEDVSVPLRFSYGYSLAKGSADYEEMLKEADDKMYRNKIEHHRNRG